MKVGIALNMLTQEGRPDAAVLADHLALGDLAEPLGFDSLFALEHHFYFAPAELRVRRDARFRLVSALVPDHHRSSAVLAFRNHILEVGIFERMIFCPDSQPFV